MVRLRRYSRGIHPRNDPGSASRHHIVFISSVSVNSIDRFFRMLRLLVVCPTDFIINCGNILMRAYMCIVQLPFVNKVRL